MGEREDIFEKYLREMMEMYKKARKEPEDPEEPLPDWSEEDLEEKEEEMPDFEVEEAAEEDHRGTETETETDIPSEETPCENCETEDFFEKNEQNDDEPSFCPLCAGGIALCEFSVESVKTGMPIENAQIMLYRGDGFFIRALTGEDGKTCEIPIFTDSQWRVSVTSQGYISVSKAQIEPSAGEKVTIPVRLDESLQLSDVFVRHDDSILGA